jgi:DNA-binding NarL/FixJ family response regulator
MTQVKHRVLIVDDHNMVRRGLSLLLSGLSDVEVVGESSDGWAALRAVREIRPDIVLMDVAMPGLNGVDATRNLLSEFPDIRVIALSAHTERKFVAEMFRIGALGYLPKGAPFDELVQAIRTVATGKRYISEAMTDLVLSDYARQLNEPVGSVLDVLSDREREVLQLIAEGMSTREIATRLFVSVKTVESHRRAVMSKMNVRSVAELTKIAIREGLTSLDF